MLALGLLGCPAPGARDVVVAVGPAGPPQLVCADEHGALVVADAQGRQRGPLRVQPGFALSALASAGSTLVGAGQGRILVYVQREEKWRWHQAARWESAQWASEPLRAASYGESAVVWMRGPAPGSVPAALEVTPKGQVIEEAVAVAERSLGGIWQSSHAPTGPYDSSFPDALRLLVAQVRVGGQLAAREEVLHSERSPWGGRLAAPDFGNPPEGGWAAAPIYYIGATAGAPPVPLEYAGEQLGFRGLIGYGDSSQLYFDGQKTKRGDGLLVINPPGSPAEGDSGKRKGPLRARLLPGLHPPCAVVGADWHD